MDKEIRINWNEEGIRIHIDGDVALWEALGVLEYAKDDVRGRSTD